MDIYIGSGFQPRMAAREPLSAFRGCFGYGDMSSQAISRIVSDPTHPERELALSLLGRLPTPVGDVAFKDVDLTGFAAEAGAGARSMITNRPTLGREDLPLIRKIRRVFAASGNPDLIDDYPFFTGIIWKLQNRP